MKYFFCKTKSGEDYDNPKLSRFHFGDQTDQIDVVSTVDVLAGAEIIEAEGELEFKNYAILSEMKVFVKDGYFCLFDGEETYGFSLKKVAGIRKINQGIPIVGWNKKDPPYAKMFQNDGLLLWNKSPVGLKYFYALEVLFHDGIHRLLFPAYELHRIKGMIPKKDIIETGGSHQEKVRPVYYWKMPKNAGRFFTHQSDVVFKVKHPVAFKVLAAVGVVVSLLPLTLFIVIGTLFFPPGSQGPMVAIGGAIIGAIGSSLVGIGLFNLVAAWVRQYLGHWVTLFCLFVGGMMLFISVWML